MEKLADGLQKLSEDDLLHVVTMVHDNKTSETYTKNDVESTYPGRSRWNLMTGDDELTCMQMASSMLTCTLCLTRWSRCCGTSQPARQICKRTILCLQVC
jgi:hypothetical protein